ncbi:unnamed protein product [Leptosia nina]|uniref:SHSP domain-containing protein n=1 Tax=Leptosia nina TaxID=320188 RepID=A0AAV1IUV9_9NEOP
MNCDLRHIMLDAASLTSRTPNVNMFRLVLIGLLSLAAAAPKPVKNDIESYMDHKFAVIDKKAREFWTEFENTMKTFEEKMEDLGRRFPNPVLQEGIEGGKYIIRLSIPGFKEDEISVVVKKHNMVVEAHHERGNSEDNFINARSLPSNVEGGEWSYDNDVLTIEFTVKQENNDDYEN